MRTPDDDFLAEIGHTVPLVSVQGDLERLEALERAVTACTAQLRAILPLEQFRLVRALGDAEQGLALAEQDLRERQLVDELARRLPEHSAVIRAVARQLLEED